MNTGRKRVPAEPTDNAEPIDLRRLDGVAESLAEWLRDEDFSDEQMAMML